MLPNDGIQLQLLRLRFDRTSEDGHPLCLKLGGQTYSWESTSCNPQHLIDKARQQVRSTPHVQLSDFLMATLWYGKSLIIGRLFPDHVAPSRVCRICLRTLDDRAFAIDARESKVNDYGQPLQRYRQVCSHCRNTKLRLDPERAKTRAKRKQLVIDLLTDLPLFSDAHIAEKAQALGYRSCRCTYVLHRRRELEASGIIKRRGDFTIGKDWRLHRIDYQGKR